jgi:hypothetical protein
MGSGGSFCLSFSRRKAGCSGRGMPTATCRLCCLPLPPCFLLSACLSGCLQLDMYVSERYGRVYDSDAMAVIFCGTSLLDAPPCMPWCQRYTLFLQPCPRKTVISACRVLCLHCLYGCTPRLPASDTPGCYGHSRDSTASSVDRLPAASFLCRILLPFASTFRLRTLPAVPPAVTGRTLFYGGFFNAYGCVPFAASHVPSSDNF